MSNWLPTRIVFAITRLKAVIALLVLIGGVGTLILVLRARQ